MIQFNKTNLKSLDEFNKIASQLESFYNVNIDYLKQYEVDERLLIKSKMMRIKFENFTLE